MQEIIIEPKKTVVRFWQELWEYRELFVFLAWRNLLIRYKQTAIGIAWSVVRPLLSMIIFVIVFGKIAKLPSNNIPYPILVFTAMLPWQFFAITLAQSGDSLVLNTNMVSKVYLPRIIIPSSVILVSFVDFLISFGILILLMLWYGLVPTLKILLLPLLLFLASLASLGAGYWISALNVKYRDFRLILPFIVQFGLYISPVGFSSSIVPEKWRLLYSLNPMVGVIEGFRWVLIGKDIELYIPGFILSIVLTIALFCAGVYFFNKTERQFADII